MYGDRPAAAFGRSLAALLLLGCFLATASRAVAQQQAGNTFPTPRLFTLTPPGAKVGTSVDVTIGGADLEEPEQMVFSNPGIKAEVIQPPAPPPPADPKAPPPPKPGVTQFKVTIAPNTPVGFYDARVINKWGVSNPRTFVVGDLTEVLEKEPNNNDTEAQKVTIGTTVNGVISAPTDVDYYSFSGTKGQRVLVSCLTLSIDSRMSAAVEVFSTQGKLLASNYRYGGTRHFPNCDALADVTLPADGDYFVRVYHFTYTTGNAEHFYRLSITAGPWIDAVHPAVVEPGKPATLTVYGRNLPGGKPDPASVVDGKVLDKLSVTVTPPAAADAPLKLESTGYLTPSASGLDGFDYRVTSPAGTSNAFLLTFARAPVVADNENNDTPETAQEVPVPCEIAGRIEKKRDRDWYTFTAKKGDVCNIEITSDRLGAPTDMYFILRNPATKADIIEGDDNPEIMSLKFFARTDDPTPYRFVAPADGKYQLLVGSRLADNFADVRHVYRVRITPDQPDFRLVVVPADDFRPEAGAAPQGGAGSLTVYAWRRDGFNGDIALTVDNLPKGVTCPPQTLAAGQKTATLALVGAADAAVATAEIKVTGTASIKGQAAVREARPASIVWPIQPGQGVPAMSRMDRSLWLAVRGPAPFNLTASIDKATLVLDPKAGDKATITLKLARVNPDAKAALQVVIADINANLLINNNQPVAINPGTDTATVPVLIQPNSPLLPGTYNLVFRGTSQVPFSKNPTDPKMPKQPLNVVVPSTPLTLVVQPKELGTVTATVANPNLKAGGETEVIVKVARKFDFAGEFKVQLVLPQGVVGVSAADVVIPAGADEAKVVLKAPADAAPGARNELVLRATAVYTGNVTTTQETKFNVNVVK